MLYSQRPRPARRRPVAPPRAPRRRRGPSGACPRGTRIAARRTRVCCIVPPSLAKFRGDLEEEPDEADVLRDGDRLWAKLPRGKGAAPPPRRPRVQSDGEPRTKPVTLDARSVATAAVALGCDPVALERRNRASPGAFSGGQYAHETERSLGHGLLLLGRSGASLRGPCARCRVRGERRGFRCRALRRHDAPECHLPPPGGWTVGSRIRCRWADLMIHHHPPQLFGNFTPRRRVFLLCPAELGDECQQPGSSPAWVVARGSHASVSALH